MCTTIQKPCFKSSHYYKAVTSNTNAKIMSTETMHVWWQYRWCQQESTSKPDSKTWKISWFLLQLCGLVITTWWQQHLTFIMDWGVVFYCEMIYSHECIWCYDYANIYQIHKNVLWRVFRSELLLVLYAQKCWPIFVTYSEDVSLRKGKLKYHF